MNKIGANCVARPVENNYSVSNYKKEHFRNTAKTYGAVTAALVPSTVLITSGFFSDENAKGAINKGFEKLYKLSSKIAKPFIDSLNDFKENFVNSSKAGKGKIIAGAALICIASRVLSNKFLYNKGKIDGKYDNKLESSKVSE